MDNVFWMDVCETGNKLVAPSIPLSGGRKLIVPVVVSYRSEGVIFEAQTCLRCPEKLDDESVPAEEVENALLGLKTLHCVVIWMRPFEDTGWSGSKNANSCICASFEYFRDNGWCASLGGGTRSVFHGKEARVGSYGKAKCGNKTAGSLFISGTPPKGEQRRALWNRGARGPCVVWYGVGVGAWKGEIGRKQWWRDNHGGLYLGFYPYNNSTAHWASVGTGMVI